MWLKKYINYCVNIDSIELINSDLNEIKSGNLRTNDKNVTFHIFSNILDIEEIDIKNMYENIIKSATGVNYVVCVSPDYSSTNQNSSANQKLDEFMGHFENNLPEKNFIVISEWQGTIDNPRNPNKPWTGCEKVFKFKAVI